MKKFRAFYFKQKEVIDVIQRSAVINQLKINRKDIEMKNNESRIQELRFRVENMSARNMQDKRTIDDLNVRKSQLEFAVGQVSETARVIKNRIDQYGKEIVDDLEIAEVLQDQVEYLINQANEAKEDEDDIDILTQESDNGSEVNKPVPRMKTVGDFEARNQQIDIEMKHLIKEQSIAEKNIAKLKHKLEPLIIKIENMSFGWDTKLKKFDIKLKKLDNTIENRGKIKKLNRQYKRIENDKKRELSRETGKLQELKDEIAELEERNIPEKLKELEEEKERWEQQIIAKSKIEKHKHLMDLRHQLSSLENVHKADRDEDNIILLKKQISIATTNVKLSFPKLHAERMWLDTSLNQNRIVDKEQFDVQVLGMLDEEEMIDPLSKGIEEAMLEIAEHEANIAELEIFLQELNDLLLKTELQEKEDTSRVEQLQKKIEPLVEKQNEIQEQIEFVLFEIEEIPVNDHDAVVKFEKQVDQIEQDKIENEKIMESILQEIRTINQQVNSEKILSLQDEIEEIKSLIQSHEEKRDLYNVEIHMKQLYQEFQKLSQDGEKRKNKILAAKIKSKIETLKKQKEMEDTKLYAQENWVDPLYEEMIHDLEDQVKEANQRLVELKKNNFYDYIDSVKPTAQINDKLDVKQIVANPEYSDISSSITRHTEKDLIPLLSPTAVGEFDTPLTKLSGKKDTTLLKLLEAEINEKKSNSSEAPKQIFQPPSPMEPSVDTEELEVIAQEIEALKDMIDQKKTDIQIPISFVEKIQKGITNLDEEMESKNQRMKKEKKTRRLPLNEESTKNSFHL